MSEVKFSIIGVPITSTIPPSMPSPWSGGDTEKKETKPKKEVNTETRDTNNATKKIESDIHSFQIFAIWVLLFVAVILFLKLSKEGKQN